MKHPQFINQELLLILLIIILILSVSLLGALYVPIADDYVLSTGLRTQNFLQFVRNFYTGWSGRLLSTMFLGITLKNLNLCGLFSVLSGLSFMLIPVIILSQSNIRKYFTNWLFSIFAIEVFYLFFARFFLAENVFWITGGYVYSFCLFLAAIWMVLYKAALESEKKSLILVISLSGILLGTAHEQLTLPIFFISVCLWVNRIYVLHRKNTRIISSNLFLLLPPLALILGFIILIIAPGNYLRADFAHANSSGISALSDNFIRLSVNLVFPEMHGENKTIFSVIILGIILGCFNYKKNSVRRDHFPEFIISLVLFISALLTLVPLLRYPSFACHRTSFFGNIFIFVSTLVFVKFHTDIFIRKFAASDLFADQLKFFTKYSLVCRYAMLIFLAGYCVHLIYPQYREAIPFRRNALERAGFLIKAPSLFPGGSIIYVKPFAAKNPSWFMFTDLSADSGNLINMSLRMYYRLGNRHLVLSTKNKTALPPPGH